MALEYSINANDGLLTVTTSGFDENVEEAVSYGKSVITACVENQCRKLLVNEANVTSVLDKGGQYNMVQQLTSLVPHDIFIAFVASPEHFADTSFGALVAENRGMHIKAFTSVVEAKEWLQEQELDQG